MPSEVNSMADKQIPLNQLASAVQDAVARVLKQHNLPVERELWFGFVAPDVQENVAAEVARQLGQGHAEPVVGDLSNVRRAGQAQKPGYIQKPGHITGFVIKSPVAGTE
jgi:hypothetical protein